MSKESDKANKWRASRDLSITRLAELTGYSYASVYWYMRGVCPPSPHAPKDRAIDTYAWHRFRLCCAAIEQQMANGNKPFDWK